MKNLKPQFRASRAGRPPTSRTSGFSFGRPLKALKGVLDPLRVVLEPDLPENGDLNFYEFPKPTRN